jgi:hypothetical protein
MGRKRRLFTDGCRTDAAPAAASALARSSDERVVVISCALDIVPFALARWVRPIRYGADIAWTERCRPTERCHPAGPALGGDPFRPTERCQRVE